MAKDYRVAGVDKAIDGKDYSAIFLKVNLDAEDAIKTLKAVQREARKATQALCELEKATKEGGELHK